MDLTIFTTTMLSMKLNSAEESLFENIGFLASNTNYLKIYQYNFEQFTGIGLWSRDQLGCVSAH